MLSHIKDHQNHWTVTLNGQPHLFDPSHPHYTSLVECVHAGDADEFVNLLNTGFQIENWSEGDFRWVTEEICKVADACCGGRVVSTLEGGYDLDALAASVAVHVDVLKEHAA